MEKDWFADLAKSYLVVAYQKNDEKTPVGGGFDREELLFEGSLNLKAGKHSVIKLGGKVSFWGKESSYLNRGIDYSLNLLWQACLF